MNLLSETVPGWMRNETLVIYCYILPLKCRLRFPYTFSASLTGAEYLKVNGVRMLYSRTQRTLAVYLQRLS